METPLGVATRTKRRRALTELRPTARRARCEDDDEIGDAGEAGEALCFGAGRRVPASASRGGVATDSPSKAALQAERDELLAELRRVRSDAESLERRREEDLERGGVQLRREVERAAESEGRAHVAEAAQREAQREARSLVRQLEEERASQAAEIARLEGEREGLAVELADAKLAAERAEAARREGSFQAERSALAVDAELEGARRGAAAAREALVAAEKRLQEEHAEAATGRVECGAAKQKRDADVKGEDGMERNEDASGDASLALRREEELAALRVEVVEARRVQSQLRAQATLEEKLLDARARAEHLGAVAGENEELRTRCEHLAHEVSRWTTAFQGVRGTEGAVKPEDAAGRLRELQADVQQSLVRQGELEVRAASHDAAVSALERRCVDAEAAAAAARSAETAAGAALKRCERKAGLLLKERDGLQAIIKSYEDETMSLGDAGGTPSSVLVQQLKEAEAALTEIRGQLHAAEQELGAETTTTTTLRADLEVERRARLDLDASVQSLRKELELAQREVEVYAARVGRGEFDPAKTKVLHFVHNPEVQTHKSELEKEVELLRAENDELRVQLRNHPLATPITTPGGAFDGAHGDGACAPSTAGREDAVSSAVAAAEATILKRRVADLEKRENRYKSIFKEQISAFREACSYLFGYRIEMAVENQSTHFVIRSMFSMDNSSDDEIRFRYRAGEGVELVPFDYSLNKELELNVKTFIHQFRCIPAFTANLTIENFNKTTISM